jgi:SAM-dependent methyltransferase
VAGKDDPKAIVARGDISAAQLVLARHHVPEATFVHADAAELELPAGSFDAVVSLYMLGHVPRGEQPGLLRRIAEWLRPGGYLLATLARGADEGVEEDWLGAPMFFSSFDEETNRRHLRAAGFELLRDETIGQLEHGTEARFQWVLARKRQ